MCGLVHELMRKIVYRIIDVSYHFKSLIIFFPIRYYKTTSISSEARRNQTSILIRGRENHVSP